MEESLKRSMVDIEDESSKKIKSDLMDDKNMDYRELEKYFINIENIIIKVDKTKRFTPLKI
jgi:hypothetical protein